MSERERVAHSSHVTRPAVKQTKQYCESSQILEQNQNDENGCPSDELSGRKSTITRRNVNRELSWKKTKKKKKKKKKRTI